MARLLALLATLLAAAPAAAQLADFVGSYVGVAEVQDLPGGPVERRDMDIVIEPFREGGFRITWINVTLVDGRRDLPGVQRRVEQVLFVPEGSRQFFVAVAPQSPFREREAPVPMRGDPVRWAVQDGPSLVVYSFVVLEDGRYELQVYDRKLTGSGLDILFERILDGEVVRRITGRTVRAE